MATGVPEVAPNGPEAVALNLLTYAIDQRLGKVPNVAPSLMVIDIDYKTGKLLITAYLKDHLRTMMSEIMTIIENSPNFDVTEPLVIALEVCLSRTLNQSSD